MFRYRALWASSIVVMGFIAAACGTATTQGSPSSTVSKSVTPQIHAYQGATLTDATWAPVVANPQSYVGAPVSLTGKLNEIIPNTSPALDQVFLDPSNLSEPIAASGLPTIPVDSYVRIQGTVTQVETFQNAFGASSVVPVVTSTRVQIISRDAAEDPTIAAAPAVTPQNQNGLTLAVSHVEFAAHATRVFLTATNDSGSGVTIDDVDATLVQGTNQLASHSISPDMTYFPTTIANGVISHDELVFDAAQLQGGSLTLTVSASSDNFNQNWNNFVFTIALPSPSNASPSVASPKVTGTMAVTSAAPIGVGKGNFIVSTLPQSDAITHYEIKDLTTPQNSLSGTFGDSILSLSADGRGWILTIPLSMAHNQIQIVVTVQSPTGQTDTITSNILQVE